MTRFQKSNLLEANHLLGQFDIILCRNVAIYFSRANRTILFNNLANHLNTHGALMIGSTESLFNVSDMYERREYMNSVYYVKKI